MDQPKTAAILVIGEEILSGKTVDENARYLIAQLRELGVALRRIVVIGDERAIIAAEVKALSAAHDFVFTSGGVGPTHDDVTMDGVADAFGTRVHRHPELEHLLRRYYGDRLEERALRMAEVPEGVELVPSDHAAWPVVVMRNVHILPGIPEIFRRKFNAIRQRFADAPFHLRQVLVCADESEIAGTLDAVVAAFPGVAVGSYPRHYLPSDPPPWKVKVTLESRDRELADRAAADLRARLGRLIVAPEEP